MKTFKISFLLFLFAVIAYTGFSQSVKKVSFQVAGECGMCKKKIESAAKNAGATYALWNVESKKLTVKYKNASSNTQQIQQSIAQAGYDTPRFKATSEAYNNLHECCQYERSQANCCEPGSCTGDHSCCADGQCSKDTACCTEAETADCCKKS